MRALPYSRAVIARRQAKDDFWLAIVAIGWLRDIETLKGLAGVARIGCPADADPTIADWRAIVGMDVLTVQYTGVTPAFMHAVWAAMWRARIATLWAADGRGHAQRLMVYESRGRIEFVTWSGPNALDASFRERVQRARQLAFDCGDAPLYSGSEFSAARASALDHVRAA